MSETSWIWIAAAVAAFNMTHTEARRLAQTRFRFNAYGNA
jgi:hypothetical protein